MSKPEMSARDGVRFSNERAVTLDERDETRTRTMNTSRTTFAIDRDVLRARAGVSIYYTIRSTPRVRALSRGEDDVVDGDAAGTKGEGGSADGRGNENRRNRKNSSSDSTTKSLGDVEDRAFLSIDPSRALRSASEGHDAFARVDRSFATSVMP
jgi:hypothetical protein